MDRTALVVDDCELSRMVTRQVLTAAGYHVLEAGDGGSALRILDRLQADLRIDLLVSDFNMPGMNGANLVKAVRQLPACAAIPMFILSSETSEERREEGLAAGATAWLEKPLHPMQILKLVG